MGRPHEITSPATTTPSRADARIEGLDLLRGVAVALVMVQHASHAQTGDGLGLSSGVVGVTIFFALSGYLITGILSRDLRLHGRIRFRRFYAHRALRLFPALVAMLGCYLVFSYTFRSLQPDAHPLLSAFAGITYTADLPSLSSPTESLGHLWSLAVEEQFYLVWPTLLLAAWRRWNLAQLTLLALVVAELATLAGPAAGRSAYELYNYPTSWTVALVVGGAARVFEPRLDRLLARRTPHRIGLLAAIATLAGWSVIGNLNGHYVTFWLGAPTIAASAVVLIFWLKHWVVLPHRALRPVLGLGVISYAAYLWNLPISSVVLDRGWSAPLAGLLTIALTLAAASASWYLVEAPIRRLRSRSSTVDTRPDELANRGIGTTRV